MLRVFYSYCRKDSSYKDKMIEHHQMLEDNGVISGWHDMEIEPGEDWQEKIDENLEKADIVIFLLSPAFLNSENCKKELQRSKDMGKKIIPVILSICAWKDYTFIDGEKLNKIQALPNQHDGISFKSISEWKDQEEAWHSVYEGLKNVCATFEHSRVVELKPDFIDYLGDCAPLQFIHPKKKKLILEEIYVWPSFEKSYLDIKYHKQDEENLLNDIDAIGKIWISGEEQSGKTSVAKKLFLELKEKGYVPILFSSPYFTQPFQGKIENRVQDASFKQYENLNEIDNDKTIIIIDDFHKDKNKEKLLVEIQKLFSKYVIITDNMFSMHFSSKGLKDLEGDYCHYKINEFYSSKRDKLIRKWLAIDEDRKLHSIHYYKKLDQQATMIDNSIGYLGGEIDKILLPLYPIVILSIVSHYQVATPLNEQITSQGHCYQALIYMNFARYEFNNEEIDSYINLLSFVAYYFYKNKISEISREGLIALIDGEYEEKYVVFDDAEKIIDSLEEIGFFQFSSLGCYSFYYLYFYYYFVAKYISDNINEMKQDIELIFGNLHDNKNAYIAIFLCHHSKQDIILDHIWLNANMLFEQYTPATLDKDQIAIMDEVIGEAVKVKLPSKNKAEENRQEIQKMRDEKETELSNQINADEQDVDEDEIYPELIIKIRKSIKTVEVMGHIIRNRTGSLDKSKIKSVFEDAMNVHLRLLSSFLELSQNDDVRESWESYIAGKLWADKMDSMTENEAVQLASRIYANIVFAVVFGAIYRVIHSLGSDKLSALIADVCDEVGSPAAWLIKRGVAMQYQKHLPVHEIANESKNFSRTAIKTRNALISHYCHFHPVEYRQKQRIQQKLDIDIIDVIAREKRD